MAKKNKVAGVPGIDATLPNVTLILGGVERHLCFDFNAIVLAEKETGINLLYAALSDVNATNLRGMLWASLIKENPDLTVGEVGSWITMHNASTIRQALTVAWFGSVEADTEEDERASGEPTAQE